MLQVSNNLKMDNQFKSFSEIDFDVYEVPQYLNPNNQERFKSCKIKLMEVHRLLDKSINIIKTSEIPLLATGCELE